MKKERFFVSLGAGVQSTAMLLMYYHGKLEPMPDAAIFADTQAEPPYVYENLDRLTAIVKDKIAVRCVTIGSLHDYELNPATSVVKSGPNKGKKFSKCPFYFPHPGGREGMGRRQCTADYKVRLIVKTIREYLGYKPRKRVKENVCQAIGISQDEWQRMKMNREKWITNVFPLVDHRLSRTDCLRYIEEAGLPRPRRSACYFCPYRSDKEWREMKEQSPETFALAVEFDRKLREVPTYFKDQYVHCSCKPLAEVPLIDDSHPSLFEGMECEGMCGV